MSSANIRKEKCLGEMVMCAYIEKAKSPDDLRMPIQILGRLTHLFPDEANTVWELFDEKARSFGEIADPIRAEFYNLLFDQKVKLFPC